MKVKIGDIVESEYGKGKVLAFTKRWLIHDNSEDSENPDPEQEYACFFGDTAVWIPITPPTSVETQLTEATVRYIDGVDL